VDEHLRVAARREPVSRALELGTELELVVDLAVVGDPDRAVLVRQRLRASVEVDDAEATVPEDDLCRLVEAVVAALGARWRGREPEALAVGTAVLKRPCEAQHERTETAVGPAADRSGDSAHRASFSPSDGAEA